MLQISSCGLRCFKPDSGCIEFADWQNGGMLGEVSALALLIGLAVYALEEDHHAGTFLCLSWLSVFIFAGIMHLADPEKYVSPGTAAALGWSDAGCCLYGNRLCDFSDE